jgi:hypothetical protein
VPQVVRLEEAPGSGLQFLQGHREGEPVGTIAIPTRDKVSAQLFISLMNTDWSFLDPGHPINWSVVQGSILTSQRNELVQRMMGDWILFIDADMVFDTRAIGRLILARDEGDYDILGGLCFQRIAPHQPTLYMRERPTSGGYLFMEKWDSDIVEVDGTGLAFVIIHRRVFERMVRVQDERPDFVWPPYEERIRIRPPDFFRWTGGVGEDLRFCQDAKATGSRIFVDTRVKIGHVGETVFDEASFLRELANRDPVTETARRKLNERLGLKTMTATEAKERLGW